MKVPCHEYLDACSLYWCWCVNTVLCFEVHFVEQDLDMLVGMVYF